MNAQNAKSEDGRPESGNADSEGKGVGLVELVPPITKEGNQRTELVEVLERYGVSVAGFDGLRSDSYEKHIASRSLAELEMVYSGLFRTSGPAEEVQAKLPRWDPEHKKYGGKPPGLSTLMLIKERIRTEQSVREWRKAKGLIAARAEGGLHDDAKEFYQEGMEILAEELLAAKVNGKPISENLKVVDRLLKAALLEVRERREARAEARLEWEKAGKPIAKATACSNTQTGKEKPPLKVGDPAPETIIHTLDGERLILSDYQGKYVLLDFWASWAGPSVAEKPWLKEVHQAYGQDERLVMISLSLDNDPQTAQDHIKKHGHAWIQGLLGYWQEDPVAEAWGVKAIPAIYLIGPEGKIVGAKLLGRRIREAVETNIGQKVEARIQNSEEETEDG